MSIKLLPKRSRDQLNMRRRVANLKHLYSNSIHQLITMQNVKVAELLSLVQVKA
ncbi:MAG: hypothetical protein V7K47_08850 [Nostoc sp.]